MPNSITLFNLDNWKIFETKIIRTNDLSESYITSTIEEQNTKGFLVVLVKSLVNGESQYKFYKKHYTSVVKSIIIGKVSVLDFMDLKKRVDKFVIQSNLIRNEFDSPDMLKFSDHKKIFFPS